MKENLTWFIILMAAGIAIVLILQFLESLMIPQSRIPLGTQNQTLFPNGK
jgi:hypothetical protein